MFTCAQCAVEACRSGQLDKMPKNCPMHDPAFFEQLLEEYDKPENHDFFVTSAVIEAAGYCRWPRLRETVEFAKRMGYTKLGLAFCAGLHKEAAIVDRYEVMCNPIAQAELLNQEGTQFNICLGLCVGHDSLFYKYSKSLVTTLVAKDRATGHNPAAAIYCADGYFKSRLDSSNP